MQLIKRKNGYAVRFRIDGERLYLYEKGWTKEDAEMAMYEYKKQNGLACDRDITVKNYMEKFYDDYVMYNVATSTRRRYNELIILYIIPGLGNIQLSKLRAANIQKFYTELTKKVEKNKAEKALKKIDSKLVEKKNKRVITSKTTILYIHRVLRLALKYAVQWGYIPYNPCDGVKSPSKDEKEVVILTDDELKLVYDYFKHKPYWIVVYIASVTGMRSGEIIGLQHNDVDLKNEVFRVRQSYKRNENEVGSTKTKSSRRSVPFLPGTKQVLEIYNLYKKIPLNSSKGFYCTNSNGKPFTVDGANKVFKRAVRNLKLSEDISFHSLRHTHASYLLKQGIHPKVVSERLGHGSVNITLNTYSHLLPDMQKDALKGVDVSVFGHVLGTFSTNFWAQNKN